jgi:dihydroorotate dehydrogenase
LLGKIHRATFRSSPVEVGGVQLPHPLILAAGMVKGRSFPNEADAMLAVQSGVNVLPGWRSVPALLGAVEFGSYTRYPRMGNPGRVMWRDRATRSTQNRVGLKNPGAMAAAHFLGARKKFLPPVFGINVAVSPGVQDPEQQIREAAESFAFFVNRGVKPSWYTLNLSCPNTGDDPGAHQTGASAALICERVMEVVKDTPLWVKVSPALAEEQYLALMNAFANTHVRAVIATNTLAQPAPGNADEMAGVGGGRLHDPAVRAAESLILARQRLEADVDIIGSGGVLNGRSYHDFAELGIRAMQYWSALVYRGPLAAAVIEAEAASIRHRKPLPLDSQQELAHA